MPLNRTPPSSPSASCLTLQIETDSKSSATGNTRKHKRKRERSSEDDDSYGDFRDELLSMFEELKKQQDKNFKLLQETILTQNKDIQSSLDFISSRYDEMQKKIESLESDRKNNIAYIQTLEERVENFERHNNAASLEIRNIPSKPSEKRTDLTNCIINIGKALNSSIQSSEIRNVFRKNSKVISDKPIVVEFTTVTMKENILQLLKSYNRNHSDHKLSTQSLGFVGPMRPVYISEHLTYKTRRLFALTREYGNKNKYSYCWTTHGRIYLRKKEGEPYHRIDSERDLEKLQKPK